MKPADLTTVLPRILGTPLARLLGLGISLVLILVICRTLYLERQQLAGLTLDSTFIMVGTFSVLVVILGNILGSIAAWILLKRHSATITLPFSIAVNGLAQMAKYLPGNVLHLLGRFYVLKQHTDGRTAFSFTLVEVLLLCLAGCGVGLLYPHYRQAGEWSLPMLALLSLLLLGCGVVLVSKLRLLQASVIELAAVVALYLGSYLAYGLAFSLLFSQVFDFPTAGMLLCAVLFALAFVAGYITPGASGGLGVREYLFMLLAQPLVDPTIAIAAVVLFRFLSVAGDLVFALLAFGVRKFWRVQLLRVGGAAGGGQAQSAA